MSARDPMRLSEAEQDRLRNTLLMSYPDAVWINVRAAVERIVAERANEARAEGAAAVTAAVYEVAWSPSLPSCGVAARDYDGCFVSNVLHRLRAVLDAADTSALDRHDAQVRAEALRDAAVEFPRDEFGSVPNGFVTRWLRDRADAQTNEADQ